jgi:hypothetical protein
VDFRRSRSHLLADRQVGIGAKIVGHARYVTAQAPDVAISNSLFAEFL